MNIRQGTNINHNYDNFNFWQIDLKELPEDYIQRMPR